MRTVVIRLVVALAVVGALGADEPRSVIVEVDAGPHDRRPGPVVLTLPSSLARVEAFTLVGLDDARRVVAQIVPGERPGVVWIENDLKAGSTRRYRLEPVEARGKGPRGGLSCVDDGRSLVIEAGGRPVLRYHHAVLEPPAGIDRVFRRSGFIHPLTTPSGLVVSDDFPPDHAHQHGLFFAWVNTTFAGHDLDFWNQAKKTGNVRHVAVLTRAGGPVFGEFSASLRHDDITVPAKPVAVLDEVWTVRAYALPGSFLIDFESRQTCAGEQPLEINKYHYGGFGLRGNRAWFDPKVKGNDAPSPSGSGESDFLTSEGKTRADGNHTRPRWVDLSGRAEDRFGGVAVLDHPDNFRAPQPVRLHPNKPYFCFAPMVSGAFSIAPGRVYVSRYRLQLHDGRPDPASLDQLWQDYADPPRAGLSAPGVEASVSDRYGMEPPSPDPVVPTPNFP